MTITTKKYEKIFRKAIDNEEIAGFQNMGDIEKAISFAKKQGLKLEPDQELRRLLTKNNDDIFLIFLLKQINQKDVAVFMKGEMYTSYGMRFLRTKPIYLLNFS